MALLGLPCLGTPVHAALQPMQCDSPSLATGTSFRCALRSTTRLTGEKRQRARGYFQAVSISVVAWVISLCTGQREATDSNCSRSASDSAPERLTSARSR